MDILENLQISEQQILATINRHEAEAIGIEEAMERLGNPPPPDKYHDAYNWARDALSNVQRAQRSLLRAQEKGYVL